MDVLTRIAMRVRCGADSSLNNHVDVEHKVWVYSDGTVAWELRRLLQAMMHFRKTFDPALQIRQDKHSWQSLFAVLGFAWPETFFPAARAFYEHVAAINRSQVIDVDAEVMPNTQYIREVASITTVGVLAIIIFWFAMKRKLEQQDMATALFCGIMARCATENSLVPVDFNGVFDEHVHECVVDVRDGFCSHVRHFVVAHPASPQGDLPIDAARKLTTLFHAHGKCKVCCLGLTSYIRIVGALIDERLPTVGDRDIKNWALLEGNSRKRKADEDYRHFMLVEKVACGQASNSGAGMRGAGVAEGTGRVWIKDKLERYLGATWALVMSKPSGVFSMVEDGARFGQPAKETQIYAVWHSASGCGVWLPPQDTFGKKCEGIR